MLQECTNLTRTPITVCLSKRWPHHAMLLGINLFSEGTGGIDKVLSVIESVDEGEDAWSQP